MHRACARACSLQPALLRHPRVMHLTHTHTLTCNTLVLSPLLTLTRGSYVLCERHLIRSRSCLAILLLPKTNKLLRIFMVLIQDRLPRNSSGRMQARGRRASVCTALRHAKSLYTWPGPFDRRRRATRLESSSCMSSERIFVRGGVSAKFIRRRAAAIACHWQCSARVEMAHDAPLCTRATVGHSSTTGNSSAGTRHA